MANATENNNLLTQATSRHLKQVSELTLLAPIKQGFVAVPDVMAYATRLHVLLRALFELRRVAIERDHVESVGPLERLRSLYDVRWAIVNGERSLLLAVTFDRSWEAYIQGIVDQAGPFLDLIFSHCEGYDGHHCRDGYAAFGRWVRAHQVQCDFFYAAAPDITVDDQRLLAKLARSSGASALAELTVGDPPEQATEENGYRALAALHDLTKWFPQDAQKTRSDRALWNAAARSTIPRLDRLDRASVPEGELRSWLDELQRSAALESAERRAEEQTAGPAPDVAKLRDNVQANILTRRDRMTHGLVALLRCADAATLRRCLGRIAPKISPEAEPEGKPLLSCAISYAGLERLGLDESLLLELPKEFREGMAARAGLIGDTGPFNSPECWALPTRNWPSHVAGGETVALNTVDLVLILTAEQGAQDEDHRFTDQHPLYRTLKSLTDGVADVLHVQALRRYPSQSHFGFVDGTSQPVPDVPEFSANTPQRDRVPLGEILLGYPNARAQVERWPANANAQPENWFEDGSFLVIRKLEQDVEAYETFANENAASLGIPTHQVKSAILGRDHRNGQALVTPGNLSNDFDYSADPAGKSCPFHSHIRRTNPRPSDPAARALTPRLLRRGFSYGPPLTEATREEERGLFFMAYNASIAQQFEVVQRWLNGGNSSGALSAQVDLFSGTLPASSAAQFIHVNGAPQPLRWPPAPLVKLRWGMYLFVPSRKLLSRWADDTSQTRAPRPAPNALQLARGRQILENLQRLGNNEGAAHAWKRVLEDVGLSEERGALWAALRADEKIQGVLDTPYGVLVGSARAAEQVLNDRGELYSVQEYGKRMTHSLGLQHLGMDAYTDEYKRSAARPNQFAQTIDEAQAFKRAREIASRHLAKAEPPGSDRAHEQREVHVEALTGRVLMQLLAEWFGAPRDADTPKRLLTTSKFVFQPAPEQHLRDMAAPLGEALQQSFKELVQTEAEPTGDFHRALKAEDAQQGHPDLDARATALASLASGFYAATFGSFLAAADTWIERGELWNLPRTGAPADLRPALLKALQRRQGPTIIYRTCQRDTDLNGVPIAKDRRVVIGIGSAANDPQEKDFRWLFGGDYGKQPHACPAQPMALGVMLGLTAALLDQRDLRRVRRFVLTYRPVVQPPAQVAATPPRPAPSSSADPRPSAAPLHPDE
jgi:Dyp-type peroxidase family